MNADNADLAKRLREESAKQRRWVANYIYGNPEDTHAWSVSALLEEAADRIEFLETQIEKLGQPVKNSATREEYREAYLVWRAEGSRMHRILRDIWHYATPGDTSHMTFGDDPGVVLDAVKEHLVPASGTSIFDAADKARWELDGQPDGADA